MQKIAMSTLSPPVRSFLKQVRKENGAFIEDDQGRGLLGVIPYEEAPPREQAAALNRLKRIQSKVAKMMKRTGKTEEQFDRIVQKD